MVNENNNLPALLNVRTEG